MTFNIGATGMPTPQNLSTMTRALEQVCLYAGSTGASAVHPVAASAYFYPVYVDQPRTYVKAWWVNGATAAGNVDVGIYTMAGTRVVACTAVAQSGVSTIQVATTFTTTTLTPGPYMIALSASLGTATFWRSGGASSPLLRSAGAMQMATAHPLPSTATYAAIASGYLPLFGFSELATV